MINDMENLKFGPIKEKLESVVVEGQGSSYTCLHDCERPYYSGNCAASPDGCTQYTNVDAYKSVDL